MMSNLLLLRHGSWLTFAETPSLTSGPSSLALICRWLLLGWGSRTTKPRSALLSSTVASPGLESCWVQKRYVLNDQVNKERVLAPWKWEKALWKGLGPCGVGVAPGRWAQRLPSQQLGFCLFTSGFPQTPWKTLKYTLKKVCFPHSFPGLRPRAAGRTGSSMPSAAEGTHAAGALPPGTAWGLFC